MSQMRMHFIGAPANQEKAKRMFLEGQDLQFCVFESSAISDEAADVPVTLERTRARTLTLFRNDAGGYTLPLLTERIYERATLLLAGSARRERAGVTDLVTLETTPETPGIEGVERLELLGEIRAALTALLS